MASLLAAIAALTYGVADFAGGQATRRSSVYAVLFWSHLVGLAFAFVAAPLLGWDSVSPRDFLWGGAAGLCGAFGIVFLYRGLAETFASVVAPISAITGAVLPVAFGLITGERPGVLSWIGIGLALPAIVLLSAEKGSARVKTGQAVRFGVLAGLGFAGFFICISRSGSQSGLWPLAAARVVSTAAAALYAFSRRRSLGVSPGNRLTVTVTGVLDMGANIFFLLSSRLGMLTVATVVSSLYPAPTVILSRIVHKERLGPGRIVGLALALAGVVMISLG